MSRMYTGTASKSCFLVQVSSEMALEGRWVKDLNRNHTLKAYGLVQARLVHRRGAKAWLIILSRVCLPALQRFTLMKPINWNLVAAKGMESEREIPFDVQVRKRIAKQGLLPVLVQVGMEDDVNHRFQTEVRQFLLFHKTPDWVLLLQ